MAGVLARIKIKGKEFEIMVDLDKAMGFKKQKLEGTAATLRDILEINTIFYDYKKGLRASSSDLKDAFATDDIFAVAGRIITHGEIQLPQEYREKMREAKVKQVVDFLTRNCMDTRTNAPYTPERIGQAIKQANVRIDDRSIEEQIPGILQELQKVMPIKVATKKIEIIIGPEHVGKIYNLIKTFKKEKEDWLNDGSMRCIINLPAGMQLEFYDKLNALTQGSAITKEVKE